MFDDVNLSDEERECSPEKRNAQDYREYRKLLFYMGLNVPVETLCLPKRTENALKSAGIVRVYDLVGRNFREIKGIGEGTVGLLTARFDEFVAVCI